MTCLLAFIACSASGLAETSWICWERSNTTLSCWLFYDHVVQQQQGWIGKDLEGGYRGRFDVLTRNMILSYSSRCPAQKFVLGTPSANLLGKVATAVSSQGMCCLGLNLPRTGSETCALCKQLSWLTVAIKNEISFRVLVNWTAWEQWPASLRFAIDSS